MKFNRFTLCFVLLFAASTCFAQMYTVTDLGSGDAKGINNFGQVVGSSAVTNHAYIWTPQVGIRDLGALENASGAYAINSQGQVVGETRTLPDGNTHAFLWTAQDGMKDLGTLGGIHSGAFGINDNGQVVGYHYDASNTPLAFIWTAQGGMKDLGTLGEIGDYSTAAHKINNHGKVVGFSGFGAGPGSHAFLWTAQDGMKDLGTLGGLFSNASAINDRDQVVGNSDVGQFSHAFLWTEQLGMTDMDVGASGNTGATAINLYGDVVGPCSGSGACLWSKGTMYNLNTLIPSGAGWILDTPTGINDVGQIVGNGFLSAGPGISRAFLLTPIYKASVQQPINADGSSVFSAKRGVVPVKFTLTEYDGPTCTLLSASIGITRTAGGTLGPIDESTYSTNADSDSNFRIDPTACQYIYNVAGSSLGVGMYQVDISINGIIVGHAVFALK